MKLIIDIDEDTYKDIKKGKVYSSVRDVPQESVLAIANGTPAEQEPCEDCVSRQAVHEMLENVPINPNDKWFNWLQKACLRLADLPPVQPKTEWIPVSERLPELHQRVLATYVTEDGANIDITYYSKHGFLIGEVIAWRSLPELYKSESEDKE